MLKIGFLSCAVFASALTGCVGYVDGPTSSCQSLCATPACLCTPAGLCGTRSCSAGKTRFITLATRSITVAIHISTSISKAVPGLSRPAPPRVSAEVLFASPSVRLDFHDHPSKHHVVVPESTRTLGAPRSKIAAASRVMATVTRIGSPKTELASGGMAETEFYEKQQKLNG